MKKLILFCLMIILCPVGSAYSMNHHGYCHNGGPHFQRYSFSFGVNMPYYTPVRYYQQNVVPIIVQPQILVPQNSYYTQIPTFGFYYNSSPSFGVNYNVI